MFNDKKISIIIPCFNEQFGLKNIFDSMLDFIDEVIVVDNNSTDKSKKIAEIYATKVVTEEQRGYGAALLKGLKYIKGDIVALMDGDGSYPIGSLKTILIFMEDGKFDFVSGCRFPLADFKVMPIENRLCNYFISGLIRLIFRIELRDSQSGIMVFKKDIIDIVKVNSIGMGFSQELKIKAWLNSNIRCGEIHIPYSARMGRTKFRKINDSSKNLLELFFLLKELKDS